jgi:tetratricopeptide (TPR) repeat protein
MKCSKLSAWIPALAGILIMMASMTCTKTAKDDIPITTSSKEALAAYVEGRDLREAVRIREAIPCFEKAAALDSNFAMAYLNLAMTADNAAVSRTYFEKAKSLAGKVSEGEKLDILCFEAGRAGNTALLKELREKMAAMYPKDKRVQYNMAGFYFNQKEYAKAIERYKKVIDADPAWAVPYNEMGYACMYTGDFAGAEKALRKCIELKPEDPNPYDSLGEILMKQGNFEESIRSYRKALSINPDFAYSRIGIGNNLLFQGKRDEAKKEFQALLDGAAVDGYRHLALYGLVSAALDQDDYSQAVDNLKTSIEIGRKSGDAAYLLNGLFLIADVQRESGRYADAHITLAEASDEIDRADLSADEKGIYQLVVLSSKAALAVREGDVKTAARLNEEVRRIADSIENPGWRRSTRSLAGEIALAEGRFDDALSELAQASMENPGTLYLMAEAYEGKGDKAKTKEFLEKTAHLNEGGYTLFPIYRQRALKKLAGLN